MRGRVTLAPSQTGSPALRVTHQATRISDRRLFCRCCHNHVDRDIFSAELAFVEGDTAFDECEQRMVFTEAHVAARPDARAALAHENVAGKRMFATEFLDAETTTG